MKPSSEIIRALGETRRAASAPGGLTDLPLSRHTSVASSRLPLFPQSAQASARDAARRKYDVDTQRQRKCRDPLDATLLRQQAMNKLRSNDLQPGCGYPPRNTRGQTAA
jgi:hypothetical protein